MNAEFKNIDEFIKQFKPEVQRILQELRQVIKEEAPEAGEKISYGMPTFTLKGNLIHFNAYEKHLGLYPGSAPIKQFEKELSGYETSKGTIRFPIEQPLPYPLIRKIVQACVKRNLSK